jgi:hypothetical protein
MRSTVGNTLPPPAADGGARASVKEAAPISQLSRLNQDGPDDLFICCASFEERSVSISHKLAPTFLARFGIIFAFEDTFHKEQADTNMFHLQSQLGRSTTDGIFIIRCHHKNPVEGISQLKDIWGRCQPRFHQRSFITVDISGFPKILILELLRYIVDEMKLSLPRLVHTTQEYLPAKLTQGVQQVTTVPNFFGSLSLEKSTVLVLFLGFEPERCLAVWQHFNPTRTILLLTNPPRQDNRHYLDYARSNNEYLLSQPTVEVRDVPADNPYRVSTVLERIYSDIKDSYNMVIGPFGTKPQTVGVLLFCHRHPRVQVVYSLPARYTRSYLNRKPGVALELPLTA